MYSIKVIDKTSKNSGVIELEIFANNAFLISYNHINKIVEYSENDHYKNNPVTSYKMCPTQLRGMLEAAYVAGRKDQVKDTAKQLKTIFGLL